MIMLEAKDIRKEYNGVTVVDIPALTISHGESVGLAGNNGAGKTTFFRIVLDLVRPSSGMILNKDNRVGVQPEWKKYTGSYLDEGFLIDFLTPDEYFYFIGSLHGLSRGEVDSRLNRFDELFNDEIRGKNKYLRDLSKGNQKKAGIAAAMLANPEMLILDEPFANLDPSTQFRLKKLLRELKAENQLTMFISSHDLSHVTEVCDRILVLEKGRIVKDLQSGAGTLKELENYFAI
jgi:ABC-2 type transport system ATP-binding protein